MNPPPSPSGSAKRVTLRDIAARFGVSQATVSLALQGHPRISAQRREEIQRAAKEMQYTPDPMLSSLIAYRRSLASSKTIQSAIAWVNHWHDPRQLRGYKEFDLYWQGAERAAGRLGYHLEEFVVDASLSFRRLDRVLKTRNIGGILLPPHGFAAHTDGKWAEFPWHDFAVIRFGYSVASVAAHVVTSHQLNNSRIALAAMVERGYRRVGYVTQSLETTQFAAGYLRGQIDLPPDSRLPLLILPSEASFEARREILADWVAAHRPDAFLSEIGSLKAILESIGHPVPEKIGIAALSILDGDADAGIYQNSDKIGEMAVELLVAQLHQYGKAFVPETIRETLIQGEWRDGGSLPPRPAAGTAAPKRSRPSPSSRGGRRR